GRGLGFFQKLGPQHQSLDLLGAAIDFRRVSGQANALDQRSPLQCRGGSLDLQVLDERDGIAVIQLGAIAVADDYICHDDFLLGLDWVVRSTLADVIPERGLLLASQILPGYSRPQSNQAGALHDRSCTCGYRRPE